MSSCNDEERTSVMIETILVIGGVIACSIWYMRHAWRRRARILTRQHCAELEILGERYARGDINRGGILGEKKRHPRLSPHLIMAANQIGRQRRQSVQLTFRPAVLHCDVAALEIAGFVEASPDRV